MNRITAPLLMLLMLAACGDGQPFFAEEGQTDSTQGETTGEETEGGTDASGGDNPDSSDGTSDPLDTGTVRPPQSADLVARGDIIRAESSESEASNGQLASVTYNPTNDTFIVDGLAFDGGNTYSRGDPISQLRDYQVYEADIIATDTLTGTTIPQIQPFRMLYGVSDNSLDTNEPRTSFAIVRTGDFSGFGYGGYLYERNGGAVLPETGQAVFNGNYAGIRIFSGRDGMELTQGDMLIAIDFSDFQGNDAVRGEVTNRQAFNTDGSPVPLGGENGLILPRLPFSIAVGGTDIQPNGEFSGRVANSVINDLGARELYEEGNYYAVIAGDATSAADGGEIAGVLLVESIDPRFEGVTAQETGGFILYR